jgi:predicted permease
MLPRRIDWTASFRKLRQKPLYALTVAAALGLGIGAATIVFSWFEGLFLRPLPAVRDSRSLQIFELHRPEYQTTAFSHPDYQELTEGLAGAMEIAAYSMTRVTLSGDGKPEQHWALFVSGNFFSTLELRAGMGRLLHPADTAAEPAAVLGYDWWRTRFKADPAVIGRTIYINRKPVKIAGVAPRGFEGPYTGLSLGLYLPVAASDSLEGAAQRLENRRNEWLTLIARLRPGISQKQASEAARLVARRLDEAHPKAAFHQARLVLKPFWKSPVGAQAIMGPVMLALAGVVLVVLLLSLVNGSGMMLLEHALRGKDMAIRFALGAGTGGLIRYSMAEALLLAALAAGIGLFITSLAADHLQSLVPDIQFPVKLHFPIDAPVLVFSVVAAFLAALFCGFWSGLEARWRSAALTLRGEASTFSQSHEKSRLRGVFIAAQIALSFLLLSSAALFYQSVERAREVDLGFDSHRVSLVRLDLSGNGYGAAEGTALFQRLLSRLAVSPGVEHAALARSVPLGFGDQDLLPVVPDGEASPKQVWGNRVSPGYFATMGIPLMAGRDFNSFDHAESSRVAIVNEALGRRLWNSPSPLGRSFRLGTKRYQVIGVVRNTKIWSLTSDAQPYLYLPLWQSYSPDAAVHVRSKVPPATVYRLVQAELEKQDAALPLVSTQTMSQQVEAALFPQRIALVMLSIFSILGMYLAAVGLYGVTAHAARSRTKEVAIRMALGARPAEICRLVAGQAARLVGAGLVSGAVLSAILSQFLQSMLVGPEAVDARALFGAAALIAVVAILGTWLPTLRATRVQAAAALRAD